MSDPNTMTITRRYSWGLDPAGLSGAQSPSPLQGEGRGEGLLEGAGTIGGLLAMNDPADDPNDVAQDYVYFHDASGNVTKLVDLAADPNAVVADPTTAIVVHYEYGPYGHRVNADPNNPDAYAQPFGFSGKYWDAETGLGNWGRRYYHPALGRWISRDPIGEAGGVNVYAYVANNPANRQDGLGTYAIALPSHTVRGLIETAASILLDRVGGQPGRRLCSTDICATVCALNRNWWGASVCQPDGKKCQCFCSQNMERDFDDDIARRIVEKCVREHENFHYDNPSNVCPPCPPGQTWCYYMPPGPGLDDECKAQSIDLQCIQHRVGQCGGEAQCLCDLKYFVEGAACTSYNPQTPCPAPDSASCAALRAQLLNGPLSLTCAPR